MKKALLSLLAAFSLASCAGAGSSSSHGPVSSAGGETLSSASSSLESEQPLLFIPTVPEEIPLYEGAVLKVAGHEVPIRSVNCDNNHAYAYPGPERGTCGYATFYFRGELDLDLELGYEIDYETKFYPSRYGIIPFNDVDAKTISFSIDDPCTYVVEPLGDPSKAIFINAVNIDRLAAYESFVEAHPEREVIRFEPGFYDESDPRIGSDRTIELPSDTILYLEPGAVLSALVRVSGAENVALIGGGEITGEFFSRTEQLVPFDSTKARNVLISGLSFIDPAAWTVNFYFTDDSRIEDVHIFSSRANGDGITLQSCNRIEVNNCFVRGFDDNLVVKNYSYPYGNPDRSTHGSSSDISFRDCYLWTDLAQSMEIGYETAGEEIRDIIFSGITVYHAFHKPVISIHNANYAEVHDIVFENITVEDLSTGRGDAQGNNALIEFKCLYSSNWSDNPAGGPTEIGNISSVRVENVLVKRKANGNPGSIVVSGYVDGRADYRGRVSRVDGVKILDVEVAGELVTSDYGSLHIGENVSGLEIALTGEEIIGHEPPKAWDEPLTGDVLVL